MGPVVGGVDAPLVAGTVVVAPADPVHHRIPQLHVLVLHVDLGAQYPGALWEVAGAHPTQQVEVLRGAAIPVRAGHPWSAVAAALGGDSLPVLVIDVGETGRDQVLGPVVQALEVVRGVADLGRVETQPGDVGSDRVDVLGLLGVGIGVVETQQASPAEVACDSEVDCDRLSVPDMQIAIGLGWEPGLDPAGIGLLLVVACDGISDEVSSGNGFGHGRNPMGGRR